MRLGIVGGGWAGLAAAVRGCQAGHQVTLFEMAAQLGGRARTVTAEPLALDNGQHILIGAYRRTLDLIRTVGAREEDLFLRLPLELRYPDGRGLRMPPGPAWISFVRGVAGCVGWTWGDRAALIRAAAGWMLDRFQAPPERTVQQLAAALPAAVRELLIDPLCVAALNTPSAQASAAVLLRVLRDALFGGRGSADLLLPRQPLGQLLPQPAADWLRGHGARLALGRRVEQLVARGPGWRIDGEDFDAVVLACAPWQVGRLVHTVAPDWAARASALRYEPIITVYLQAAGVRWPAPMLALAESATEPAQYAFDHGRIGHAPGRFAFVVSGARQWAERGAALTAQAVLDQARRQLPPALWTSQARVHKVLVEKRATFRCTPGLDRPETLIAPRLAAAGDYVQGPYPATLESAVRAGESAVAAVA